MQTFSVLIAWSDSDKSQGSYGVTVRATSAEMAEDLARKEMRASHIDNYGDDGSADEYEHADGVFGGSVLETSRGAIWHAAEMEAVLRSILTAGDTDASAAALATARKIVADLDKLGA